MKFTYDPRYNIAYICFRDKTENVDTIKISDELNIDISSNGSVYGIELLNANAQIKNGKIGTLEIINEESGEKVNFPLAS
jgi:uncharacterized protein YuzE